MAFQCPNPLARGSRIKFSAMYTLMAASLLGCGGGGGGGAPASVTPQSVTVSGVAAKGLIKNATVCAYEVVNSVRQSSPIGGESVGCVATDSNGAYTFTSLPATANPVIFEVSHKANATVQNEITGQDEPMEPVFRLKTYLASAQTNTIAQINVFTDIAVEMSKASDGRLSPNALAASEAFVSSELLGGRVDPFKVAPSADDPNASGAKLYNELSKIVAILPDLATAGGCPQGSAITCALTTLSSSFQMDTRTLTPGIKEDPKALRAIASYANKEAKLADTQWTNPRVSKPQAESLAAGTSFASSLDPIAELFGNGNTLDLTRTPNTQQIASAVQSANSAFQAVDLAKLAREKSFEVFLDDLESGILAFEAFANDQQQKALVDKFGDAVEEVAESTLFEFIDILGDRCSLSATSLVCSSSPLPLQFGSSPSQSGYSVVLTQASANSYTYVISKQSTGETYSGSVTFASGQVSMSGTAPTFYEIGLSKFPRSSTISFSAVVSPSQALSEGFAVTQGVPISLTITGTQASAATTRSGISVPAVSANFSNLILSLTPGTGNTTEVSDGARFNASGNIVLTVGNDRLNGQLSANAQANLASLTLTGALTLVGGQTGTLGITLTLDDSNLTNPQARRTSSNFQKGGLEFSLSLGNGSGSAYAGINASYREAQSAAEFNKASLSTTFRFSKAEGQRFVTLSTTGLPLELFTPEASAEIGEISSSQLMSVVTSGGFKVTLPVVNPQSGTHTILNADNQEVGKIQGGLIYIGGTVTSLRL